MFNVVVVVLFLIALGLLWKTREHLAPTADILEPAITNKISLGKLGTKDMKFYSPEQVDQIWSRIPESIKASFLAPYQNPAYDDTHRATILRDSTNMIAQFYTEVYAPASSPITLSDIDKWMSSYNLRSPEYREVLAAYFVQGGQTSEPTTPSTPQPAADQNTNASTSQPAATTPIPAAPTLQPVSEPKTIDIKTPTTITINVRP